jgi:hypothetical protein
MRPCPLAAAILLAAGPLAAQEAATDAEEATPAQESGAIGSPPPEDVTIEITAGPNGEPVLSTDEILLMLGGYYRINVVCPDEGLTDETGFHWESPEFMQNMHLRVVSVGDIEIYMQGLSFNAIECDEQGAARFSFHPMRAGVYPMLVRDHSDPPQQVQGRIVVE